MAALPGRQRGIDPNTDTPQEHATLGEYQELVDVAHQADLFPPFFQSG
jgi:hypothetical protein